MNTSKQRRLDKIAQDITRNNICPELAENATQLVFGDGNPDADIVFIGEGPGKNEDQQGRPFVGAAGKFLDEMLEQIDMDRSEVYITNIIKYRPPDNRDPRPDEINAFMPYLLEQIEVIEPQLIATLGRFSMNVFLPDLKISQVHGEPKRVKGRVFLPMYHPAAALYNGDQRTMLMDDFAKIPSVLEKINEEAQTHR
ncbi:uracil-DNA glycosylase [Candidatus Saccharibacteria bacterium QS_5_54_17]|nr:MAG: uracil-DNA glycosylase [Candidatus Saccharibacteria bacterium QS_5_54_17]